MKATILKSVLLLTLVFAGVLNADLSAKSKFFSNEEMNGELVMSKTIYLHDGHLQNHIKYNYTYDESSRITSKEALKWNADMNSWTPYYRMNYSYGTNEMVVEFARWNSKENAYNLLKEKNVYEIDPFNKPVAYLSYKWDNKNDNWKEVDSISYMNQHELFAIDK